MWRAPQPIRSLGELVAKRKRDAKGDGIFGSNLLALCHLNWGCSGSERVGVMGRRLVSS